MNEKQKNSHEEPEGVRDSSVANVRAGQPPDESDVDPDLIWEADAQLYKALSRLRTVRIPGKGKLSLQEAMKVASDQYEVYCAWSSKGGPLGKLKAWVEGKEVFKTLGPPVFDSFSFNWPPLDEGVLQITTEHERKQVVLYNLQLHDVPPERSVHKELLPNGQHLVLTITRHVTLIASAGVGSRSSQTERFSISIAIQSHPARAFTRSDLFDLKRVAGEQDDTKHSEQHRRNLAFVSNSIGKHSNLMATSKAAAATVSTMLIIVVALMLFLDQSSKSSEASSANFASKASVSLGELQTSNNDRQFRVYWTNETANAGKRFRESMPEIVPANTTRLNHIQAVSSKRKSGISWRLNKAELVADTAGVRWANYRKIEKRFAAIAGLQHVSVRVKNSEATQADNSEWVRSVFAQAFQASSRFKVLNDSDQSKAELVIKLRFEPTERTSGFVFVDIRDSNGKFIWQDFADCTESRPTEQGESFLVAAGNLVSSLEEVMGNSK